MTIEQKEEIVRKYVVSGIPMSSVDMMCEELGVTRKELADYMFGQTMAMVGGEGLLYEWDVIRFIKGLPVID